MKNRDKYILKVNEYDMLCKIQSNIMDGYCWCVIEALTGGSHPCENDKMCTLDTCKACIQGWLNNEG